MTNRNPDHLRTCLALIESEGNCFNDNRIYCSECPIYVGDCNSPYKAAVEWLINHGHKEDLLEVLI